MVIRAGWSAVARALLSALLVVVLVPVGIAPAKTLRPGPPLPVGTSPKGLAIGDVNGDGLKDIVTANYADRSFTVLLQSGGGAFSPGVRVPLTGAPGTNVFSAPASVFIADVITGDNLSEVIVGDSMSQELYVFRRNPSGGFDYLLSLPAYYDAYWLVSSGPAAPGFGFDVGTVDAPGNLGIAVPVFHSLANGDEGGTIVYRRTVDGGGEPVTNGMTVTRKGFLAARTDGDGLPLSTIAADVGDDGSPAAIPPRYLWSPRSDSSHNSDEVFDTTGIRTISGNRFSRIVFAAMRNNFIAYSGNDGATWRPVIQLTAEQPYATSIVWDTESSAFVVGPGGKVAHVSRLPDPAVEVPSEENRLPLVNLLGAASPSPGELLTCGAGGFVFQTNKAFQGSTEISVTALTGDLHAIAVRPAGDRAVAVGDSSLPGGSVGMLLDSGASWSGAATAISASITDELRAVAWADNSIVMAVGNDGLIYRSTDAGVTWSSLVSPFGATVDLRGISFHTGGRGAISAAGGRILVTTDSGASWTTRTVSSDHWNTHRTIVDGLGNPFSAAIGDVNGDNWPDFGIAGFQSGGFLPFYLGRGGQSNLSVGLSQPDLLGEIRDVKIGDLNSDGLNDVVGASYRTGQVGISYQNSIGQLAPVTPSTTFRTGNDISPAPVAVAIGDLNQDSRNDLIVANSYNLGDAAFLRSTGSVGIYKQQDNGVMRFLGDIDVGRQPSAVAIAQLDADAPLEVVVANARDNTVQILKYGPPNPPKVTSVSHPTTSTFSSSRYFYAQLEPPADFDGVEGFYYRLDKSPTAAFTPTTWGFTTGTSLAVDLMAAATELGTEPWGQWYLHAVTKDVLGDVSVAVDYPFLADMEPPTTPVPDDGVATYTASPRRTFTWAPSVDALSGLSHYMVSINASSEAPADLAAVETTLTTTQFTVDGLSDGVHTFRVRARDKAGNYSAIGLHKAYVDAAPPELFVNEPPDPVGVTPTFTIRATDGAEVTRITLSIDGTVLLSQNVSGTSVTTTMTPNLSSYAQGPHTLTIEAYDLLGHRGVFTRTISLDKSGLRPIITSTSHPSETSFANTYVFLGQILAAPDVVSGDGYYYVMDRSSNTVPTAGSDYTATGSLNINLGGVADEMGMSSVEGTWTLHAVGREKNGSIGSAVARRQILVDTIAPTGVTPDDGVASWSTSPRRVFKWNPAADSLSGVARYWVSVNAKSTSATDLAAVETSQNVTKFTADGLTDGVHTFRVRAQDWAGNYGPIGTHYAYVDAAPPTAAFGSVSSAIGAKPSIPVKASDGAGVTKLVLKLDGKTVVTKSTAGTSISTTLTPSLTKFSSGRHTLSLTAYSRMGHTTTVNRTVILDKTAPSARVSSSASKRTVSVRIGKISQYGRMVVTIDGKRVRNTIVKAGSSYTVKYTVPARTSGSQFRSVKWSVRLTDPVNNVRTYSGSARVKFFDMIKLGPDTVQIVYY
ncbi:MAG: FG-GAP-like repeat-containing protein [Coriobacteriia bacterium]|nr:FG-GAP-like repeat-containing protein [Coriobacteriia bacterium]